MPPDQALFAYLIFCWPRDHPGPAGDLLYRRNAI